MKTEQGYTVTRTDLNQPIDSVALTLSELGKNLRLATLETIDSSLFGSALYVVGSRDISSLLPKGFSYSIKLY